MHEPVRRESALARLSLRAKTAPGDTGIVARERALLGHINLRGNPQDPRFLTAVQTVLGVAPPVAPNRVVDARGNTLYWLGPDEWLAVTADERSDGLEDALRAVLVGVRSAVTDVSGGQTVLMLRGGSVREVLAKGCPLDLHPRVFDVGQCSQSHLAKAPILIRQLDRQPSFEIVIRRSFAAYFWLWLEDASAEFGLAVSG